MKRTYSFIKQRGVAICMIDGREITLPMFAGVFKHPSNDEALRALLLDAANARKYTREALRKLPWSALRTFPRDWLLACVPSAGLPEGRRRAVEFMLSP